MMGFPALGFTNGMAVIDGCSLCRVSSASWYFLNVFGLRRMYTIILGEETGKRWLGGAEKGRGGGGVVVL